MHLFQTFIPAFEGKGEKMSALMMERSSSLRRKRRRESSDGKTLLVDYAATPEREQQKLFGHGVYTSPVWLRFHLDVICDHFYSQAGNIPD